LDNVSGLPAWLSDALSRIAGNSMGLRSDQPAGSRRSGLLILAPIGEVQRRPESELWLELRVRENMEARRGQKSSADVDADGLVSDFENARSYA